MSLTAPYFHDGRFATLEQVAPIMWASTPQKTRKTELLSEQDIRDLVEFLRIL